MIQTREAETQVTFLYLFVISSRPSSNIPVKRLLEIMSKFVHEEVVGYNPHTPAKLLLSTSCHKLLPIIKARN
jgi:hypothetical protein